MLTRTSLTSPSRALTSLERVQSSLKRALYPLKRGPYFESSLKEGERPWIVPKEPCILCKEPYILQKRALHSANWALSNKPYILPKEPCILPKKPHIPPNKPYVLTNEPYILPKEPYILSNEPYILPIEPCILPNESWLYVFLEQGRILNRRQERRGMHQVLFRCCTFVQKSPIFYQMSPILFICFFGAGPYLESSTWKEGDVIKCRFTCIYLHTRIFIHISTYVYLRVYISKYVYLFGAGSYFKSSTRQEGDVINCCFILVHFSKKSAVFYQMSPTFCIFFFGAGSYFESSTRQEGDVIQCRFTLVHSCKRALYSIKWALHSITVFLGQDRILNRRQGRKGMWSNAVLLWREVRLNSSPCIGVFICLLLVRS